MIGDKGYFVQYHDKGEDEWKGTPRPDTTLMEKQSRFAEMVGRLLYFIFRSGYSVSFGEAFRCMGCKHGKSWSLHRLRLAIDLNLFIDGEYMTCTESHRPIGEYWESIGGTWGGRFGDGNHYSLEHDGRK